MKTKIRKLVKNEEYNQVFNYFHDEYTKMLKGFLIRNNVEVTEDDCLINYIVKTRMFKPEYTEYTIPISNAMYNEQYTEEMKYNLRHFLLACEWSNASINNILRFDDEG